MSLVTFDNKGASFKPGREVPNKEPGVSKFVVEELYRVHRKRVLKMKPMVVTKAHIPEFLKDTNWKQAAVEHEKQRIQRENETIYGRIQKRELEESPLRRSMREHIHRVDEIKMHSKRLKEAGRLREANKIKRENELILQRIERARPEYTLKSIKNWYKHHIHFKEGRRSDPTAGHIIKNLGDLAPPPLPSIASSSAFDLDSVSLMSGSMYSARSNSKSVVSSLDSESRQSSIYSSIASGLYPLTMVKDHSLLTIKEEPKKIVKKKRKKKVDVVGDDSTINTATSSVIEADFLYDASKLDAMRKTLKTPQTPNFETDDDDNKLQFLASKNMLIPFDSSLYCVKIFTQMPPDGSIIIRVYNNTVDKNVVIFERIINQERAVNIAKSNRQTIFQAIEDEDPDSLFKLLHKLFLDSDQDNSGYLSLDELEEVIINMKLEVSSKEISYVINEMDDNGNGTVEMNEFIPVVAKVILSFRAIVCSTQECMQYFSFVKTKVNELSEIVNIDVMAEILMSKLQEQDKFDAGVLTDDQMLKALFSVKSLDLNPSELYLTVEKIPKDKDGKKLYKAYFASAFRQIRHTMMMNSIIEQETTGVVQKELLQACVYEELESRKANGLQEVVEGIIPLTSLKNIIAELKLEGGRKLSRLEIALLSSTFVGSETHHTGQLTSYDHVSNAHCVHYFHYVPIVSRAIDVMNKSKYTSILEAVNRLVIKQSEKEWDDDNDASMTPPAPSMSPKSPKNAHKQVFARRFSSILERLDVDKHRNVELDEFIRILISLDLEFPDRDAYQEIMDNIDTAHNGFLTFNQLSDYLAQNMSKLELRKHVTSMSIHLHRHTASAKSEHHVDGKMDYISHLHAIFKIADLSGVGFVDFHVVEDVLSQLDINVSTFQLETILSHLHPNEEGLYDYHVFIPIIVGVIESFDAKEQAVHDREVEEIEAMRKAQEIFTSNRVDIDHMIHTLEHKLQMISNESHDAKEKLKKVKMLLADRHLGLSKTESSHLISKLFKIGKHFHYREYSRYAPKQGKSRGTIHAEFAPITLEELTNSVADVRIHSIMRNLLLSRSQGEIHNFIVDALTARVSKQGHAHGHGHGHGHGSSNHGNGQLYAPVDVVYDVLEHSNKFHLYHSQIQSILSWVDCYDATHTQVNIKDFAHAASHIVENMMKEGNAANVDDSMTTTNPTESNVLSDDELHDYFIALFDAYKNDDDEITPNTMFEVVKNTPKIKLSKKETTALISGYRKYVNGNYRIDKLVPYLQTSIKAILRERKAGKQWLEKFKNTNYKNAPEMLKESEERHLIQKEVDKLRILATRFIDCVKLKFVGEVIVITLPGESTHRRSTLAKLAEKSQEDDETSEYIENVLLSVPVAVLPLVEVNSKGQVVATSEFKAQVTIITREKELFSSKELIVKYQAFEMNLSGEQALKIALRSCVDVDKDTAKYFAENLLDNMYMEYDGKSYRVQIK